MPIGNVSRCLLCACLCTFCQMTALTAVAFKPQVLQLLVERFGKGGVPLVCKKCKQVLQRALRRMQALCNSKVANHMLQTMRAFAARDLFIGEARTSGRVHVGLTFSHTSKWEPTLGRTARKARAAVAKAKSSQKKIEALQNTYRGLHYPGHQALSVFFAKILCCCRRLIDELPYFTRIYFRDPIET